jgi:hypothetical protein
LSSQQKSGEKAPDGYQETEEAIAGETERQTYQECQDANDENAQRHGASLFLAL